MKKLLLPALAFACAIACALGLAACNGNPNNGTQHQPSTKMDYNDFSHWYVCSVDGCKEQWDASPHMFDNGVCAFCGKTDARHVHQWSQAWEKNDYFHWHPCTADGCEIIEDSQKDGFAPHDYTNGDCVCGQGWLNIRLNPDNESYTVYGINARDSYYQEITVPAITVPSTYNGKPVTAIGENAFANCTKITSITVPEGVTRIGNGAFDGCTSLKTVTLPDSLTSEEHIFNNCPIETATVPAIATRGIGNPALKTVVITSGEEIRYLNHCASLTSVTFPASVKRIGEGAFWNCTALERITIPDSVTFIGSGAFNGCTSLADIHLPEGITSIGNSTFYNCSSLTSITIPDGVTSIEDRAFIGCTALADITVPDSVIVIEDTTADNKAGLDDTAWYKNQPDGLVYAGKVAYAYKGERANVTSVTLQEGTKGIASRAFRDCTSLDSITIPDSVESIGGSALYNTAWLNAQPDGLVYAGKVAYAYKNGNTMPADTSLALQADTKGISDYAFYGCENLTYVTMPDSVTNIGRSAFEDCGLYNVTIPDSVRFIGYGAFNRCNIRSATVPAIAIKHVSNPELRSVTVTSGDEIPDNAFENRANLRIVEIASTVKRIGKYAFADCGQLGMYLDGHPGRRITIPEGVTNIGDHAFSGCTSLESITLPDSLTHIGDNVFDGCAHLEKITFQGTVAEWRAVEKSTDWNRQTGDYVIWCSDGKIGKND